MRPILFYIGETPVSSFFFMIAVAALFATFYAAWIAKRSGLKPEYVLDMGMIGTVAAILGGRIFHILVEAPDYYWEAPIRVFEFWRGGFVSWGGALALLAALFYYFKLRKLPMLEYFDVLAVAAPIIKFFLRVACLMAGCCYGKPTDLPWGISFANPDSTAFYFMGAIPLHPTQIYSMIHAFLLFVLVNWVYVRRRFAGQTLCVLAVGWTLPRAFIEFFRADDDRGIWMGISTGQIMGVLICAFFVWLYFRLSKKHEG